MPAPTVMTGFFGKLQCRGDFLRSGLPTSFVSPWDGWISGGMAVSRDQMGEAWLPAWLEAPIWNFMIPAGQCWPDSVLGLWIPSVDAAGRYFPLTVAVVFPGSGAVRDETWLRGAEDSALAALDGQLDPAALQASIDGLPSPLGVPSEDPVMWWTNGAPRVGATTWRSPGMPAPERFVAMLADRG